MKNTASSKRIYISQAIVTLVIAIGCVFPARAMQLAATQESKSNDLASEAVRSGTSAYEARRFDEALIAFQEAVRLAPNNPDPTFRLSLTLVALGKVDEADKVLKTLVEKFPETKDTPGVADLSKKIEELKRPSPLPKPPTVDPLAPTKEQLLAVEELRVYLEQAAAAEARDDRPARLECLQSAISVTELLLQDLSFRDRSAFVLMAVAAHATGRQEQQVYTAIDASVEDWHHDVQLREWMVKLKISFRKKHPNVYTNEFLDANRSNRLSKIKEIEIALGRLYKVGGLSPTELANLRRVIANARSPYEGQRKVIEILQNPSTNANDLRGIAGRLDELTDHNFVESRALSVDGSLKLVWDDYARGRLCIQDTTSGMRVATLALPGIFFDEVWSFNCSIFSPNSRLIAIGGDKGWSVWDIATAAIISHNPNDNVKALFFSKDSKLLGILKEFPDRKTCSFVDIEKNKYLYAFDAVEDYAFVNNLSMSSDGQFYKDTATLLVTGREGQLGSWPADGKSGLALTFRGAIDKISYGASVIVFSPDGRRAAIGWESGMVELIDYGPITKQDGLERQEISVFRLLGHTGPVSTLVFSEDNQRLVTISSDRTRRTWDIEASLAAYKSRQTGKVP